MTGQATEGTEQSLTRRQATLSRKVTLPDCASVWDPQLPQVASTPFVLGLAELCCIAVASRLQSADTITVGVRSLVEHRAAVPIDSTLTADAVLNRRVGRRWYFSVTVSWDEREIARIRHLRVTIPHANQ